MYQVKWLLIQVQSRFNACPSNPKSTPPLESCEGKFVLHLVKCRHPRSGVGVGWGTKMAKLSCCLVRGPGLFICPLPYCGYLPPSLSWNDFHLFPQENMYKAQRSQLLAFWSTKLKVPRSQKLNFPRLGEADKDLRPIKYPRSF